MQCDTVAVRAEEMAKAVDGIPSDVAQTAQKKTRPLAMKSRTKRHILYCTRVSEHSGKSCKAL